MKNYKIFLLLNMRFVYPHTTELGLTFHLNIVSMLQNKGGINCHVILLITGVFY